jgi:hypothetical protein
LIPRAARIVVDKVSSGYRILCVEPVDQSTQFMSNPMFGGNIFTFTKFEVIVDGVGRRERFDMSRNYIFGQVSELKEIQDRAAFAQVHFMKWVSVLNDGDIKLSS